ncbi:D-alanine--D-alanine ligase [Arthrobacter sp. Hiyo4]|nr:D-alanine--D-alanine ligase [Arthrobacter sp. Hiyo4]
MPGEISVAAGTHEFYDFNAKYVEDDAAALSCPADIPRKPSCGSGNSRQLPSTLWVRKA